MGKHEGFSSDTTPTTGSDGSAPPSSASRNLIEQAMAGGEADATFDPLMAARFLWAAWNGVAALSVRADRMAFDRDEVAECLRLGRRLVNEGLTNPAFRDDQGRSRATLVEP